MNRNRLFRQIDKNNNDLGEGLLIDEIFIYIGSLLEYFYGYTYHQTQIQLIQKFNSTNLSYNDKLPYFLEEEYKRSETNFISTLLPFFDENHFKSEGNNNHNISQFRVALDEIYKEFHSPLVYERKTDTSEGKRITDYSSLIQVLYSNKRIGNTIKGIGFLPNKMIRINKLVFLNTDDISKYKSNFEKVNGRRFRPGIKTIYAINKYAHEQPNSIISNENDDYIIVRFELDSDLYRYYNEGVFQDFSDRYKEEPEQKTNHVINKNYFTWASVILKEGFGIESDISKIDCTLKIKKY